MGRLASGYDEHQARVEMLPLIDIVFLLLVFFIYAMLSMVMHRSLKVELPAASTAAADRQDYVSITITADNRLLVGEKTVDQASLVPEVKLQLAGRDIPVFISGDRSSDLGVAVQALDSLRAAGIREVSIECRQQDRP